MKFKRNDIVKFIGEEDINSLKVGVEYEVYQNSKGLHILDEDGDEYYLNVLDSLRFEIIHSTNLNNGGKTDYYQLDSAPFPINDFDDFAEFRGMNGNQFNIGKIVWTFNVGRHNGTTYERDLNKIIHYAQRELKRIEREKTK